MTGKKGIKAVISGKVQGVYYRVRTKKEADRLGVKGWVRNLANGCVEAVFKTDEKTMEKMIQWCRKGSPGAVVTRVETEAYDLIENINTFDIKF